jgi:translation elongation factor EF-Ts
MMNQTQRDQLEKAYLRAEKSGVHITGKGSRKSDGATIYTVSSKSQPNTWHLVTVAGAHLICDCPARTLCMHRAVVYVRLLAERQVEQERVAREEQEQEQDATQERYGITEAGREYLRVWRQSQRQEPPQGIMHRTKPFSLLA